MISDDILKEIIGLLECTQGFLEQKAYARANANLKYIIRELKEQLESKGD